MFVCTHFVCVCVHYFAVKYFSLVHAEESPFGSDPRYVYFVMGFGTPLTEFSYHSFRMITFYPCVASLHIRPGFDDDNSCHIT